MVRTLSTLEKTTTWTFDPTHSAVEFSVKHMMISTVRGRFKVVDVKLGLDETNLANSSVEAVIDVASIETNEDNRDNHLRSADFLDAATYPTLTFKSKRIEPAGEDQYRVIGDLTIRDVTREVALDATFEGKGRDPYGNERVGFTAKTAVNRKDFGLIWNVALEAGGVLVGDAVKIEIQVEAIKGQ